MTVRLPQGNNSLGCPIRLDCPAARMMAEIIGYHLRSGAGTSLVYPHPARDARRAKADIRRDAYGIWPARRHLLESQQVGEGNAIKQDGVGALVHHHRGNDWRERVCVLLEQG